MQNWEIHADMMTVQNVKGKSWQKYCFLKMSYTVKERDFAVQLLTLKPQYEISLINQNHSSAAYV